MLLNQKGFSLAEIIVAIFMVLVLFSLAIMEVRALEISRTQRYEDVAYHVANKEMESLRATAFDNLPPSGSISDTNLSQIPSGLGSFTVSDYSGYSGMKEIIVTVSWDDGANKSVVIRTLAGTGGINQ